MELRGYEARSIGGTLRSSVGASIYALYIHIYIYIYLSLCVSELHCSKMDPCVCPTEFRASSRKHPRTTKCETGNQDKSPQEREYGFGVIFLQRKQNKEPSEITVRGNDSGPLLLLPPLKTLNPEP